MSQSKPEVRDLPPSAKLILKVLEYNSGLTQKELVKKSRLSQRTVRDALNRLEEQGVVEKQLYLPDARQNLYEISTPETAEKSEISEQS